MNQNFSSLQPSPVSHSSQLNLRQNQRHSPADTDRHHQRGGQSPQPPSVDQRDHRQVSPDRNCVKVWRPFE
ncbi:hypothetical protein MTO96_028598 [Rhipicephalus appendiculatus]